MNTISPEEKQRNSERALVLAQAFYPNLTVDNEHLAYQADRLMSELGPNSLKKIHRRFLVLGPQDLMSFQQMVKDKAHRSVLTQFLGATQDHPEGDRPSRDQVYRQHQERRAKHKAQKPFEAVARWATPLLTLTTCALVAPWALSHATVLSGLATGGFLEVATSTAALLDPLIKGIGAVVMEETGGWLSKAGLVVGLSVGWGYAGRVFPDLKSIMSEPETAILDSALGPEKENWKLHANLRKIPMADRHLLAHLLPSELRAFLRGNDDDRRDILQRQPPPLLAEAMSVLATHPPGVLNFFRAARDLADLCLPNFLKTGPLVNARLDLSCRLERWRVERKKKEEKPASAKPVVSPIPKPGA